VSTTTQETRTNKPAPGGVFDRLVAYRQQIPIVILGVGLALAAIPIANFWLYAWTAPAVFVWGTFLSLFVIGTGIAAAMPRLGPPDPRAEADRLRVLLLVLAGGAGFATAVFGLLLPFTDAYRDKLALGIKEWRANPRLLVVCGSAFFGGLVLMFAGLQLARVFERTQPGMRRLVYGYNAILGSLLLASILGLLNVLPYSEVRPFSYVNRVSDWTSTGYNSLTDQDRNFLANELKEPIEVLVLLPGGFEAQEVETLLNNCRSLTPLISWRTVSRDRNRGEFAELVQKYQVADFMGLLVLYGKEPNVTFQFVNGNDLVEEKGGGFGSTEEPRVIFKGETALLSAIKTLAEGKTLPTLYFTQGHNEPKLDDLDPGRRDSGMGLLKSELSKMNFKVEPLTLNADTKKIPEDAEVVVVARPTQPLEENVVAALRDYLQGVGRKGKGRMIVLLDAMPDRAGVQAQTGLEKLLAEYNVKVGNDRILSAQILDPLAARVFTNPESNNPIARAFFPDTGAPTPFLFYDARTVAPLPGNPGMPGRATAEVLMVVEPHWTWAETDLKASPSALVAQVRKDAKLRDEKTVKKPLPVAVAVSEGGMPPIPGHPPVGQQAEPRLIVFGDAGWLSNQLFSQNAGADLDLFSSCVSWLRGKSTVGTSAAGRDKERDVFRLKRTDSGWRLVLLPIGLMLLAVVVLGSGVWVVRRR
jgi:hypothetical protein